MDNCKHVGRIRPAADHSIVNPQKWLCAVCGTTESVWACLSCANVACGRYNDEHALQHFQDTKHPLALEVNEKYCFCYECDEYILNDNAAGDLKILRQALSAIANQSFQGIDSPNRRLLRSKSFAGFENRNRDVKKLRREDKGFTALKFRRVVLLMKVFQAWRIFVQETKKSKAAPKSPAKDDLSVPEVNSSHRALRKKRGIIQPGITGLRNLGNTCYMNSILQVLSIAFQDTSKINNLSSKYYMRQTTVDCFQEVSGSGSSSNGCISVKGGLNGGGSSHSHARIQSTKSHKNHMSLSHELHSLLRVMWSGKWARVSPHSMLQAVWKLIPFFKGYSQQDAQEFLCEFLDKVQSELESFHPCRLQPPVTPDVVREIFQGQLVSQVTCLSCGHKSETHEPFMDLSLEFPERFQVSSSAALPLANCHLKEMLTKFTSTEKLDGPIYACEQCNGRRRKAAHKPTIRTQAEKRILISRLPRVLRLHLKRFVWSGRNNRGKISAHVDFQRALDVSPYCATECDHQETMYSLSAAVVHHGRGFGSGHYTAYCWNQQAESWLHCNDSRIELCSMGDVTNCQAYILVYTRCEQSWQMDPLDVASGSLKTLFEEEVDHEVTFNYKNSTIPKFLDLKRKLTCSQTERPPPKRRRTMTW